MNNEELYKSGVRLWSDAYLAYRLKNYSRIEAIKLADEALEDFNEKFPQDHSYGY